MVFLGVQIYTVQAINKGFHDLFSFHYHVVSYLCTLYMKRRLAKFISFFLIGATIFASTGVVIASHVCSTLKKSDVSLFENKGCCGKNGKHCSSIPSQQKSIKKNCCQLSISYHKLNVSSTLQTGQTDVIAFPQETAFAFVQTQTLVKKITPRSEYKSGGIELLLRLHLLLI